VVTTPPVEIPVTIGVLGTHSTGKSTFLARLAHELRTEGIQVATVADLGEQAQRRGLPLLFNHTWASTLWIITTGMSHELEAWLHADVVLVDRPVPDALGYYRAALHYRQETPEPEPLALLENLVRFHSRHYSLILRTTLDPDIPLGTDKVRDTNPKFRELADRHVGLVLSELKIPHDLLSTDNHDHQLQSTI
jgi:AAA domain